MKQLKIYSALLCLAGTLTFCACGGDDDASSNNNTEIGGGGENGDKELTPQEQKNYIDASGREFITHFQSSQFSDIWDIARYASSHYSDDKYDCSAIDDRFEDIFDAIVPVKQGTHREVEEWSWTYIYNYTTYKKLYKASNFTGHFNAGSNGWEYTKANDLQFTFKDGSNNTCVLTLTHSGEAATVYVGADEEYDWDRYEYDYENNSVTYYIDEDKLYFTVPKTIKVTLTRGGSTLVSATVNTDISNLKDDEVDLTKTNLTASADIKVQDIDIKAENVAYKAGKTSSASVKIAHQGKDIFAAAVELQSRIGKKTDYDGDEQYVVEMAKDVKMSVNFLGKVQVKGTVSDAVKLNEYLEKARDNDENEAQFKSFVNLGNGYMNLGIYFDNGSTKQAGMALMAFENGKYGYRYWSYEPVLQFGDGTSYSTLSAFFNETDFKKLIEAARDLVNEYENEADRISF